MEEKVKQVSDCPVYLKSQGKKWSPYAIITKELCLKCPFYGKQCSGEEWKVIPSEVKQELLLELDGIVAEILRDVSGVDACRYYTEKILAKAEPLIRKAIEEELLDRPKLREEIERVVCETCHLYDKCKHSTFPLCYDYKNRIDQILVLIPDEELIRKDEKERIIGRIYKQSTWLGNMVEQVLKEDGKNVR